MPPAPLDDLSEREKLLLRLLAEGHTVKTASALSGDTTNAANELLRSARRKLGVASSREAARLLTENEYGARENRDGQLGIKSADSPALHPWYLSGGGIMFASIVLVPTFLALSAPQAEAVSSEVARRVPSYSDVPKVVETFPAHGSQIEPGPFEMRITFDRPMMGQISIWRPGEPINLVQMSCGDVEQSEDLHSFAQVCEAVPGAQHIVFFGHATIPMFRAVNGAEAEPYVLSFTFKPPA
jgi:DNA-binding CsgD family transcriptional regulator